MGVGGSRGGGISAASGVTRSLRNTDVAMNTPIDKSFLLKAGQKNAGTSGTEKQCQP